MRCIHCNVDVAETRVTCPLCGEHVQAVAPVLPGLSAPAYPDYKPIKKQHKWSRLYVLISTLVCLIAAGLDVVFFRGLTSVPVAVFGSSCVWAFTLRPITKKSITIGNYVVYSTAWLTLLVLWCRYLMNLRLLTLGSSLAPVYLAATAILLIRSFLRKQGYEQDAVYSLWMLVSGIVLLVLSLVRNDPYLGLSVAACILTVFYFASLCVRAKGNMWNELKAILHV